MFISNVGFACGLAWSLIDDKVVDPIDNFLNYPLSSLLNAYMYSVGIMIGTNIVADIMPPKLRFIVPTSICISVLYCGYIRFKTN